MVTISTTSTNTEVAGGSSDTGSSTACLEMSAEQEFCLYELETTDSTSVGLVLRAIYDTGDVHKFVRALERRIAFYDKNILKVCTYHYQGFLDSIRQLIHLNEKCKEIKKITEETNEFIQSDSEGLLKKAIEIVRYRRLQRNANLAIGQISICLPALEGYINLQHLMDAKKYLQALKVLEDLEHNHFIQLQNYRFAQFLIESVGPMRNEIRNRSYSDLTDFLEDLRKASHQIGDEAIRHTEKKSYAFINQSAQQINLSATNDVGASMDEQNDIAIAIRDKLKLSDHGALVKKNLKSGVASIIKKNPKFDVEVEKELNAQDRIDYGPIHRCCQIFNVLGDKESFEVYYRKQRREQASVLIHAPIKTESISCYDRYLKEVMGFFVVEDRIMQSQPSLVSVSHRNQLWEMALQEVVITMNAHFGNFLNVELMLEIKKVILFFTLTIKSYGYNTGPLYTLLQNFRDQYNEVLMAEYSAKFENALESDNYTPIMVYNDEEYKKIVDKFSIFKRTVDKEEYPRKFPFSHFVLTVLTQAKGYLLGCLRFMDNLQLSQSEINDTIRRYANILLTRWSGSLKEFVSNKNCSLIQLVQTTINMGYLERSCDHLEQFISRLVSQNDGVVDAGHLVMLNTKVFRDTRSDVEQLINHALEEKVSAFLEIANYDWDLTQAKGIASEYVMDLVNFLKTTFISFTNLPNTLARNAFIQTCKHLADSLHQMLIGPDVKAMSMGALEQFSLDVIQCELFVAQRPVPDIDDDTLRLIFAPVRQILDLLLNDDWTTYFAQRGKPNGKYSHVKASSAAALLERLIEFDKKGSGFFNIGRGDRKKLYDTILRKLRALND